ncbi:hypothetical protein AeRB84_016551, partial [Aphanomyces euteiches]
MEDEVYEGTFTSRFLKKQVAQNTELEDSTPLKKPKEWPTTLKTHDGELPLLRKTSIASIAITEGMPTKEHHDNDIWDPPGSQIFSLQAVPDLDQSKFDPEVIVKEGIDMTTEEMEAQLAFIPEITPDPTPIRLEDLDYGEPDQATEDKEKMRAVLSNKRVDVGNARPIAQRARRVRPEHLKQLFELLKGLLEYGLITFSKSPWASPIVIVLKKGGKDIRLCIDYRAINDLQSLLLSPMPTLDSMLANFDAVQWFLSLDNASGFWVVRSTRRARLISAFICPLGHFEWTRMAQGLKNAPMIYQRMITNALFGFVDLPPGVADLDED